MLKTIKIENTEPLTPWSRGQGAVYDGQLCSYSKDSLVGSYSGLPAPRERLGSLGSRLTFEIPGFPMSQGDGAVLQWAGWLGRDCNRAALKSLPQQTGREMAVGVWGHLSGEYSVPHVGVVGTAPCPELSPLPGQGCAECVGRRTRE